MSVSNENEDYRNSPEGSESRCLLSQSKEVTYEDVLAKIGNGRFHYCLLALCGWALSSDAVEILSISFILPPATCDLGLTDSSKGWLNSAIFIGMMIGGYMWGTLSDMWGRRTVLIWSLTLNALGALMSTFAQSYWLFLLLRIISGAGVGGSMPVIFAYFTEFQSKERRGAMISLLATFWMCGSILAAAVAWMIIPRHLGLSFGNFHYNTWRLFLALCAIPSFTSVLLFVLMPESPKYLIERHKKDAALHVLRKMYKVNGGEDMEGFNVQIQELDAEFSVKVSRHSTEHLLTSGCKAKISSFFSTTVILMKPPILRIMCIMIIIFFTLSFGYYGLFMWLPEMFQHIENYGGSVCNPGNMTGPINVIDPCSVSSKIYLKGFLIALSNLPGNIFTIMFIDKLGRTPLLAASMVLSGVSVGFIWFLKTELHNLIMSCIFSGISVIGFNALDVLSPELFPTTSRSTASGILTGIGRIAAILGNLTFGTLVATHCAIPMLLVAGLLCGGGLISLNLPNTMHRDLL